MRGISKACPAVVAGIVLIMLVHSGWAQEAGERAGSTATSQSVPKKANGYRVDFVIRELEDGKRVNARSYMMMIDSDRPGYAKLRVGSRVPIATGANQVQYQDVGMNIDCRLVQEPDDSLGLATSIEWSSIAPDEGSSRPVNNPVLRQLRFVADSPIPAAKPSVIGTMDEITIDAKTYLPKVLKKYALDSDRTNGDRVCLLEVRFHWNQPISHELFVPGPLGGKR